MAEFAWKYWTAFHRSFPKNAPVLFLRVPKSRTTRQFPTRNVHAGRRHGSKRDGLEDVLLDQRFRVRIISSGLSSL